MCDINSSMHSNEPGRGTHECPAITRSSCLWIHLNAYYCWYHTLRQFCISMAHVFRQADTKVDISTTNDDKALALSNEFS